MRVGQAHWQRLNQEDKGHEGSQISQEFLRIQERERGKEGEIPRQKTSRLFHYPLYLNVDVASERNEK